jgi:hypothetical protein
VTQEKAGLGEQALNKMAEMALSSQLDDAEKLQVKIKTDPSHLAKGEVDSLAVKGEGLITPQDLRMEELQMQIDSIAVNPLSALFGKVELTKTSSGTAKVVLAEGDIARALNSDAGPSLSQEAMRSLNVNAREVECHILADGKIAINTSVLESETGAATKVAFTVKPTVSDKGQGVVLQDVQVSEGKEAPSELIAALVEHLSEVLNLRSFHLEGISLQVQSIDIELGKLTLLAEALISKLPKK